MCICGVISTGGCLFLPLGYNYNRKYIENRRDILIPQKIVNLGQSSPNSIRRLLVLLMESSILRIERLRKNLTISEVSLGKYAGVQPTHIAMNRILYRLVVVITISI